MATKNRIVHRLWIIQITTIPRDKISKQNCLRFLYQERVGIKNAANYSMSGENVKKEKITYDKVYICNRRCCLGAW